MNGLILFHVEYPVPKIDVNIVFLQKAIEYNPKDGYAHYVLGRWCFQVASVGWIQRKAAAALFASPPESTYEQALEHFFTAESREYREL